MFELQKKEILRKRKRLLLWKWVYKSLFKTTFQKRKKYHFAHLWVLGFWNNCLYLLTIYFLHVLNSKWFTFNILEFKNYKRLCFRLFWAYTRRELLDSMVILWLTCEEPPYCSPQHLHHFTFAQAMYKSSSFPTSLPIFTVFFLKYTMATLMRYLKWYLIVVPFVFATLNGVLVFSFSVDWGRR